MQAPRKITERNPTRRQNNPGFIILCIGVKKSVWQNKEIQTPPRNSQIRCIRCIYILPYGSSETPYPICIGTEIPYPTETTTGLKISGPPNKHQKSIPSNLVLHIYRKHHYHLSMAIGNLVAGDFILGMMSWDYSATPKVHNKLTRILRN